MIVYAADSSIALVYTVTNKFASSSSVIKFFGNPDNYARTLSNLSASTPLPIHLNHIQFSRSSDYIHSITVNRLNQWLYFGNNYNGRVQKGLFVYNNNTIDFFFNAPPITYQVSLNKMFSLVLTVD